MLLLVVFLISSASAQYPLYGPSQLDHYARLINSGNLGGFGWFNKALDQGEVKGIADLDGHSRLDGLPPLPLTHDEVLHQLTSTPKPSTTPATAKPTTVATMAPPMGLYAVNSAPEMPPRPEDRIRGKFDDDGVFHPDEEEKQLKRNQVFGAKIKELPDKQQDQPQEDVNDYENDAFYDDPALRVPVRRVTRQQMVDHAVQRSTARKISHDIHPRQTRPQTPARPRFIPRPQEQVRPAQATGSQPRPFVPQPVQPPQPQYPNFVFRPAPPASGREQVLSNLLTEIEEYDDFLEQHRVYREQFPAAKPVLNPYRLLPEGQLPTLPRPIQYQAQPPLQQQLAQQAPPAQWALNGVPSSPQAAVPASATENPLLSIFNIFRSPSAVHAAPTQLNIQPLPLVNPLAACPPGSQKSLPDVMLPLPAVLFFLVFPSLSLITEDDEYHRDIVNFVNNNTNLWKAELNKFVDPIDTLTSFFNRTHMEMIKKMMPKFGRNGYLADTLSHLKNLLELNISIPDSYDPRKTWYQCWSVHQIFDQAGCGSCWAITAASIMSDRICIASKGKVQVQISAEDLIECCDRCGKGCQGLYNPLAVFTFWKDVGVVTGGSYGSYTGCKPYSFPPNCGSPCSVEAYQQAKTPECSRNCSQLYGKSYEEDKWKSKSAYWMRAPYDYSRNETNPLFRKYLDKFNVTLKQLKIRMIKTDLMLNGPLFACFNIHEDFLHYKSGIYYTKHGNMKETYGHCVKLLGWGEESGQAYWIYANTWGRRWGEYGFYRVHIDDLPREIAGGLPDIQTDIQTSL